VADAGAEGGVMAHADIAAATVITSNSPEHVRPSPNLLVFILAIIYTLPFRCAGFIHAA
jgi:hypothetical protein